LSKKPWPLLGGSPVGAAPMITSPTADSENWAALSALAAELAGAGAGESLVAGAAAGLSAWWPTLR
jgi:hypothetical protein